MLKIADDVLKFALFDVLKIADDVLKFALFDVLKYVLKYVLKLDVLTKVLYLN